MEGTDAVELDISISPNEDYLDIRGRHFLKLLAYQRRKHRPWPGDWVDLGKIISTHLMRFLDPQSGSGLAITALLFGVYARDFELSCRVWSRVTDGVTSAPPRFSEACNAKSEHEYYCCQSRTTVC